MFNNNKFGSRKKKNKPTLDGYIFDSEPELKRYVELKVMQEKGLIRDLKVHPEYILYKGIKNNHGQHIYQWKYTADFEYFDLEIMVLCAEDVKSLTISSKTVKGKIVTKKFGTSQLRSYKLTRNQFMRMNPHILFREIC